MGARAARTLKERVPTQWVTPLAWRGRALQLLYKRSPRELLPFQWNPSLQRTRGRGCNASPLSAPILFGFRRVWLDQAHRIRRRPPLTEELLWSKLSSL